MKVASLPEDPGVPDRASHYFRGPREDQGRRLYLRFRTRHCNTSLDSVPPGDSLTGSRAPRVPSEKVTQRHAHGWRNSRKQPTNQKKRKKNELRGQGRHHPPPGAATRGHHDLVLHLPPSPASHLTPQEASAHKESCSAAAVPRSRAAGTRAAVGGGGSAGEPGSLPLAPWSTLSLPLPERPRVQV